MKRPVLIVFVALAAALVAFLAFGVLGPPSNSTTATTMTAEPVPNPTTSTFDPNNPQAGETLNANRRRDLFARVGALIQDRYVDAELNGLEWDALRESYEPRVIAAARDEAFYAVMDEFVAELGDGVSDFLTPAEVKRLEARDTLYEGYGLLLRGERVRYVAPGSAADEAGLAARDHLLNVDGNVVDEQVAEALENAQPPLTLEVQAPGDAPREVTLTRSETNRNVGVSSKRVEGVGYVHLPNLSEEVADALPAALDGLNGATGLILDLRGAEEGTLGATSSLAGMFGVSELGETRTRGETEALTEMLEVTAETLTTLPLVVLIDLDAGPHAHLLAAALRAQRASIVGQMRSPPLLSVQAHNLFGGGARLLIADAELAPVRASAQATLTSDVALSADWLTLPERDDPHVKGALELLQPTNTAHSGVFALASLLALQTDGGAAEISGEMKAWQRVTLDWRGPRASETDDDPNPFLDFRLQVLFTGPSGQRYDVPGFFAGDGTDATSGSVSSNTGGDVWRVHFTPDEAGEWRYEASFRAGAEVTVDLQADAGTPAAFDGDAGSFVAQERDPAAPGFKAKGRLGYVGEHYLQFAGDGSYFLKIGIDEPENWLAYAGFDNTSAPGSHDLHDYATHVQHWRTGDPTWSGEAGGDLGKGIIGWLNYMAEHGLNSIYFLPMNIGGDGKDTWPYVGPITSGRGGHESNDNTHFDLSKLAQWDVVFNHAQARGVMLHFVLNEAETKNKEELGFDLSVDRKLFYRELVARFGYHNALRWNLSEEYNSENAGDIPFTPEQIKEFAAYLGAVDPYDHAVTVHNWESPEDAWTPFLGDERFHTTSLQWFIDESDLGLQSEVWREKSARAGRPLPTEHDEFERVTDDLREQAQMRKTHLWPILLSGGQLEYIIEGTPRGINVNDLTPYDDLWRWSGYAGQFMAALPFAEMTPNDALVSEEEVRAQVLSKPGEVYAVYLPDASGAVSLDLPEGDFAKRWYNPRTGSFAEKEAVSGGGAVSLGTPPSDPSDDWVVLLEVAP